jgi:hypothetical protein
MGEEMTVIFTCGHKAKDDEDGWTISTIAYTRENNRAVDYRTVCDNCYRIYEEEDMILFGEAAIEKWLEGE